MAPTLAQVDGKGLSVTLQLKPACQGTQQPPEGQRKLLQAEGQQAQSHGAGRSRKDSMAETRGRKELERTM